MKKFNGTCERCAKHTLSHTMSMFNTDLICIPCSHKEERHQDYEKARKADLAEIRKGNYNFAGIGKPADL
jgi:hypothetical protein